MVAFGGLEAFCLFEEVDDRYPKSLCISLKNVSDRIYWSIYISLRLQDLAAKNDQKWPLLDKKWGFYDAMLFCWNYLTLKIASLDNVLQHIWKPK